MWCAPQEKGLPVESGDIEGAAGDEGGTAVWPNVSQVHSADGGQCHEEDEAAQRQWRLG